MGSRQQVDFPKGRWAQRVDAAGITVKSVLENDSVIPFPASQDKRIDSDGSKDSSIDSGTEVRQYSSFRRETMVVSKRADGESPDFIPCPESYQELTNGEIPKQVQALTGKVTMTRGDMSEISRNRHLTDDSSIGSYRYEDVESTEHDGDVEDYSEGEGESTEPEHADQRLIYYPHAEDNPGSDYTVNAMDVEELRRSQRRLKKPRPDRLATTGGTQSQVGSGLVPGGSGPSSKMSVPVISVSAATGSSVSGSQDSEEEELEEDEEEEDETAASTPSADASDRNLMSMLSMSTESLDHVGQREKYLKNTYESLVGGAEDGNDATAERSAVNNKVLSTSISSQFRGPGAPGSSPEGSSNPSNSTSVGSTSSTGSTLRNVAVINAARQIRHDSEAMKKREELLRRLEETRRKLQSVGLQSSLKTSQSISDLSNIPEDSSRKNSGGVAISGGRKENYLVGISADGTTNHSSSMAAPAADPTNSTNTSSANSSSATNLSGNAFGRRGGRPSAALFLGLCPAPYRPPHHQQHHNSSGIHGASNHSLPESPVCEPVDSPLTFLTHRSSNKDSCIERNSRKTRTLPPGSTWSLSRSCSYFIDLNTMFVKSESSPSICPTDMAKDEDDEDGGGNFSSDSLEREEDEADTHHGIPRRCVSDYTICQREASMVMVSVAPSENGSNDRRRRRSAGAASVGASSIQESQQQRRPPLPPGRRGDGGSRRRRPATEAIDPDINHLSEGGEGSTGPSSLSRRHRPVFRTRSLQDTSSRRSFAVASGEEGGDAHYDGFDSNAEVSSAIHSPRNWSDGEQRWRFKYSAEDFGYQHYAQSESAGGLPVSGSSTPSSCASPKHVAWRGSDGTSKQQYPLAKRVTLRQVLPSKSVFNHVSGKVQGKGTSSAGFRTLPRQTLKQTSNSSITRSSSVGVLNQSDSENDLSTVHRGGGRIANGLLSAMRPTISSQNKVNGVGGKSGASSNSSARRRSLTSAFSSGNLNHVGNEDSSSEEAGPSGGKSNSSGQQRPRSTSIDSNSAATSPMGTSGGNSQQQSSAMRHSNAANRGNTSSRPAGERDLGRTAREVTQRLTASSGGGTGGRRVARKGGEGDSAPIPAPRGNHVGQNDDNSSDSKNFESIGDIASAPLTLDLCSSIVERLSRSADAVVHLHKRISLLEGGTTPQHQQSPILLRTIEEGVVQAQETLRLVCEPQNTSSAPIQFPPSSDGNLKHRDFPSLPMMSNLTSAGQGVEQGNPAMVQMMQQYSDMLLSLVQQRMGGTVPQQNQSQMAKGGSGQGSS